MDALEMMHIVNNIFLPSKLPQEDQSGVAPGGLFVRLVAGILVKHFGNIDELQEISRTMKSWGRVQQDFVDWKAVDESIKGLIPGQTFGLFVRDQNAGLTVSIPASDSKSATLAVFRVAASSSEVMGAPGVLFGTFPGWSVTTLADRVQNAVFAKQVADLANTSFEETLSRSRKAGTDVPETRDVVDARYVTAWLLQAVAGHSLITGKEGVARVQKKIRDEVLWKNTRLPWRRSAEYMAVKVVLHSTLVDSLGNDNGLITYKMIMLQVMSVVLHKNHTELDTDVIMEMLSKLARRLSKLERLPKTSSNTYPSHLCLQEVLKQCCQMMIDIRGNVDKRWKRIIEREALLSQVIVDKNKIDFIKDTKHLLLTAMPHLLAALAAPMQPVQNTVSDPKCLKRNKSRSLPDVDLIKKASAPVDIGETLYDIEIWVRDVLWVEIQYNILHPSIKLFNLLVTYIGLAKLYYKDDCLGSSKLIITTITIVAVLDRLACLEHPMLREYHPGVDAIVLRSLLLPLRDDMEHLTKLESYFVARSNGSNQKLFQDISLISEDVPSPNAFLVRCARMDPKVQEIVNKIEEFADQKKREKEEELSRERKKHNNLVFTAAAMECDMFTDEDGLQSHAYYGCRKCSLTKEAANMKVGVYEFPLPADPYLKDAVVYELVAPISSWIVLRDALHLLHRDLFSVGLSCEDKKGTWLNHGPLQSWVPPDRARLITLCSTTKLFVNSHYKESHPSHPDDYFIKPNCFNVRLMEYASAQLASKITYKTQGNVSSLTTLDAEGAYKSLQWTIDGTSHTENQVLAKQVHCPPELSLSEYKAFGTLRAGRRLQIRNIIRVIEMKTLSLSQPSVVNLFSQALWESGPPLLEGDNDDNDVDERWFRESHLDLRDQSFAQYAIRKLLILTGNIGENWKDHLALLSIIIVGARMLAMSKAAWEQAAAHLLCQCRKIAEKWSEQIEQVLGTMMASPIEEVQRMRSRLVDVAAIAALTFDVDVRHLPLVMRDNQDVTSWLRDVARIYDNTLLNSQSSKSVFQRNLLRRVQITALRLEETLQSHLLRSKHCLDAFLKNHWADADQGHTECWEPYASPCERWWRTRFKHMSSERDITLQFDTLQGCFLVNGCPVGRLPATITDHQDYKRVFGRHVFQVQPAAASSGILVSVHKLNGAVFTFDLIAPGNRLVVKERHDDGRELELFPSRFLNYDLPELLIEHYSHWILRKESNIHLETDVCVLFRPIKFDDDNFDDINAVPFKLNIRWNFVHETQRDRFLVDVCSTSFKVLYDQVLCRLELPHFVHVFVDKLGNVSAELPRLGLSFDIESGNLLSREQPGFFVAKKQSLGTLIGLRHGILLKEQKFKEQNLSGTCVRKRSLLLPHSNLLKSTMETHEDFGLHPVVNVDLLKFSSPSFFIFDVDDRLRCLRGPASPLAWLYLALVHAVTSHPLPDPFTGLTGAESAMRLLQSPRCWSCKPYAPEAVSILQNIANLSPIRNWYPLHLQCMQTVTWPTALFSSTALDAYGLVVEKLIEDSERLRVLFPSSNERPILPQECSKSLRIRGYWRSRNFFGQEAHLNPELEKFLGGRPVHHPTNTNLSANENSTLRSLAEAGHTWRNGVMPLKDHLRLLLLNCKSLKGACREDFSSNPTVSAWRKIAGDNSANHFLDLYNLARQVNRQNRRKEFTLLLSLLAFLGGFESEILFMLLFVAVHTEDFQNLNPPQHETYEFTNEVDIDLAIIRRTIECHKISFDDWKRMNGRTQSGEHNHAQQRNTYRQKQAEDIMYLAGIAQRHWPDMDLSFPSCTTISSFATAQDIGSLFTRWRKNRELHEFVAKVEDRFLALSSHAPILQNPGPADARTDDRKIAKKKGSFDYHMPIYSFSNAFEVNEVFQSGQFGEIISKCKPEKLEVKPSEKQEAKSSDSPPLLLHVSTSCKILEKFTADLRKSWSERHMVDVTKQQLVQQLVAKLKACKVKSKSVWDGICAAMQPSEKDLTSRALEAAGLWRRVIPVVLLPYLVSPAKVVISRNLRSAFGALAVIWTLEQQAERCLRLLNTTMSQNDVSLQKELVNTGHLNWSPKDRPEWLLLELEGDYLMRSIQVDVANKMLKPDGDENAVLQLNMGEGKTSVIVPALCVSIPDGKQFARLTVLSSLFRINFDMLAFKLGGLLNRRVYTFPCRRDMKINSEQVEIMKIVYEECIAKHGVVVTLPEHRLSAQLMVLELCRAGLKAGPGAELWELQELVNNRARDILDESDLILQVKYQVVYTIGEQMKIDGSALRWKVSQSVLRSAQHHLRMLSQFGPDKIEFKEASEGAFAFPHVRLLSEELNMSLCMMIADDILEGGDDGLPLRELRKHDKALIRSFVLPSADIDVSLESIQKILPAGPLLNTVLILRGILCYGVLMHVLRLRWRVQYGVRPSGRPKMAVPFRAKDVPVERAEYGHPDVAIMLTHLSYYNSGLSDKQLIDAFERLQRLPTREYEYRRWLKDVPKGYNLPGNLSDVNLDDIVQRGNVLKLCRNMRVVDFWLSEAVFPIESKQFEGKLVASAWDLCVRNPEGRPVSGFSGTKDTSLLLPDSIIQRDLPSLQGTDGAVIETLLRKENSSYHSFPSCINSFEILKRVVDYKACVLLDVGALMVDLSNLDVATKWLALLSGYSTIEAAIYFDDCDNQIMAVDRDGRATPLPLSPYHRKMECCVVYLDDVHTRGTDLKIPRNYHACVTLGRGITKDCLVQACMRMRMLGAGHSVSFWASQEVHTSILSILPSSNCQPTSSDVLHWVIRNSAEAIKDGFRHWGSQGIAHCRKQAVNHLYRSLQGAMSLHKLGCLNTEKEVVELIKCYGYGRRITSLPAIMKSRLQNTAMNMKAEILDVNIDIVEMMKELGDPIIKRIAQYAGGVECFAQVLDEEQEHELEHELEEEGEIQRPGEATPHTPHISLDVRLLATEGYFNPSSKEFLPLLKALQFTSLWQCAELEGWSTKLFVTREFATVLSPKSVSSGVDFLRPVAWLAVVPCSAAKIIQTCNVSQVLDDEPQVVVLLSPFEVNELLPHFRHGRGAHLHMFAPRLHAEQDFMLCERALTLPTGDRFQVAFNNHLPLIAELLAFSGSAFFANDDEQSAYCNFLGLCPRPRSKVEDDAFDRKDIQFDGFVLPEKRNLVKSGLKTTCAFEVSPVRFMIDLLSARGWLGHLSSSHVGQILLIQKRSNDLYDKLGGEKLLERSAMKL